MAPRQYKLGKRALQSAETQRRIVDAAIEAFIELGIPNTSMIEVARRADVAPATVLNHFKTPHLLIDAVLDCAIETLDVPTARIFEGADSLDERARRLVTAMFEFYDRSNKWFDLYQHEYQRTPEVREAESRFWADIQALYAQGLGDLLVDARLAQAVFGLTGPGSLGSLRSVGMSVAEASDLIARLVLHLIDESSRGTR